MYLLKLIARNALRHKLRTILTVVGLTIAVLAYGLLNTVVDAWYAGAAAASNARLVTREDAPAGGSSGCLRLWRFEPR
jgi:putative ABC transport system permease protein